ncbi:hypothetical protein [uncultured Nitrospira sp.]|uniref:hypothetical protein n=1 Tax=uncultured Nitrospira sp. TaxID=157176 RepID=UPI0031407DCA
MNARDTMPAQVVAVKPGMTVSEVRCGDAHFRVAQGASRIILELMLADPKLE